MRLKSLLILPIISIIGLSLSIQFFSSIIIGLIVKTLNLNKRRIVKKIKSEISCKTSEEEITEQISEMWKCRKCSKPVYFGMTSTN